MLTKLAKCCTVQYRTAQRRTLRATCGILVDFQTHITTEVLKRKKGCSNRQNLCFGNPPAAPPPSPPPPRSYWFCFNPSDPYRRRALVPPLPAISRLGLGEPILISSSHGDGMADIARALVPHYETWEKEQEQKQTEVGLESH